MGSKGLEIERLYIYWIFFLWWLTKGFSNENFLFGLEVFWASNVFEREKAFGA